MSPINEIIQEVPLLHVDIRHGENQVTRVSLFEGDDLEQVAADFSAKYEVPEIIKVKLVEFLKA